MKKELIISCIITAILIIGTILWNQRSMSQTQQSNSTPSSVVTTTAVSNLTAAEIKKHDSASDCWIIINKNAYNVTSYLNDHPGGSEEIIRTCGTDATTAFHAIERGRGHSATAEQILPTLLVGAVQ